MCIRDRPPPKPTYSSQGAPSQSPDDQRSILKTMVTHGIISVSYTHLRAHETVLDLVCRLLLEKKKKNKHNIQVTTNTSNKQSTDIKTADSRNTDISVAR